MRRARELGVSPFSPGTHNAPYDALPEQPHLAAFRPPHRHRVVRARPQGRASRDQLDAGERGRRRRARHRGVLPGIASYAAGAIAVGEKIDGTRRFDERYAMASGVNMISGAFRSASTSVRHRHRVGVEPTLVYAMALAEGCAPEWNAAVTAIAREVAGLARQLFRDRVRPDEETAVEDPCPWPSGFVLLEDGLFMRSANLCG